MEASKNRLSLSDREQLRILTKLSDAEIFEQFIHRVYGPGTKRFSLEGAESLIPLLDLLIERAADEGVGEIVMGMAHRGRLNVLTNILDKSFRELFAAFEDADADRYLGSGDVKYHHGYSTDRVTGSNKKIHLTLTFNPSHLEFVNPVAVGRTRAKQDRLGSHIDTSRRQVMPLLIHGDAALHRPGRRLRDAEPRRARGLLHGRHRARHRQQPDRLHHEPRGEPIDPLRVRHHADAQGPRLPRER